MKPMSAREQRLVAIALLIAVIALLQLAVIAPLVEGFSARAERRVQLSAILAQNERSIARIASMRRTAEAIRREQVRFAQAAPTPAAAAELLRDRLEKGLTRSGGILRSSESVEAPVGWVKVAIAAELSSDQLSTYLQALRNEPPYLVTDSLTISADRALTSGALETLDVKIEASIPFAQQR